MTERLRLVFAGTPDFAVPSLQACLAADVELVAVYTQPDRPAGRGRNLSASPVKVAAQAAGIPVEQPASLGSVLARRQLAQYQAHLLVVVAYGLILSERILALPRFGCWNVHASLLPRWRGAAPIQRAILAGDTVSGVCLMQMEKGLDTGPVITEQATDIAATETAGQLHDRLARIGADLLAKALRELVVRRRAPATRSQSDIGSTYASKIEKAEARLDPRRSALELTRTVRAFDPWPIAEADIAGEKLRVWAAEVVPGANPGVEPGTLVGVSAAGLDLATGDGVLRITEVQRAGGRRMPVRDFLNARADLRTAAAGGIP